MITNCIKTFPIGYEKLYYLVLSATSEFNFDIKEMQSRGGYIVFKDSNNREFLASIIFVSSNKSMLKITPCDNNYNFSADFPQKFFSYIEAYQNKNF